MNAVNRGGRMSVLCQKRTHVMIILIPVFEPFFGFLLSEKSNLPKVELSKLNSQEVKSDMHVSDDLRELFRSLGSLTELRQKTPLLEQGEINRHAYFIESGCLRMWHTSDGSDTTVKFFLQGELCASLESFNQEEPSSFGIETIVPSIVRKLSKKKLEVEVSRSPILREYISSVLIHCAKDYQQLFLERIAKKPSDRYLSLVEEEPKIMEIVPLHYIASFLGITPVSLSRIRAKIESN